MNDQMDLIGTYCNKITNPNSEAFKKGFHYAFPLNRDGSVWWYFKKGQRKTRIVSSMVAVIL